jgi:hypothetical protein
MGIDIGDVQTTAMMQVFVRLFPLDMYFVIPLCFTFIAMINIAIRSEVYFHFVIQPSTTKNAGNGYPR